MVAAYVEVQCRKRLRKQLRSLLDEVDSDTVEVKTKLSAIISKGLIGYSYGVWEKWGEPFQVSIMKKTATYVLSQHSQRAIREGIELLFDMTVTPSEKKHLPHKEDPWER